MRLYKHFSLSFNDELVQIYIYFSGLYIYIYIFFLGLTGHYIYIHFIYSKIIQIPLLHVVVFSRYEICSAERKGHCLAQ